MKKITASNYRKDKLYPRVVRAVNAILSTGEEVIRPIDVFVSMDILSKENLAEWRAGHVPYLEKVIHCNLSKANRILRILRLHAHNLNLVTKETKYQRKGKHRRVPLRFSKTRDAGVEQAYLRHYVVLGKKMDKVVERIELTEMNT